MLGLVVLTSTRGIPGPASGAGILHADGVAAPAAAAAAATASTVVLDTCVLLADSGALFAFGHAAVVLPLTVIEELDDQKSRMDDVGRAARATVRLIEDLRQAGGGDLRHPVPLPSGGSLRIELNGLRRDLLDAYGLDATKADNRILAAALGLQSGPSPVTFVSADVSLRIKASQLGLTAEDYHRPRGRLLEAQHPGWWTIHTDASVVDALYDAGPEGIDLGLGVRLGLGAAGAGDRAGGDRAGGAAGDRAGGDSAVGAAVGAAGDMAGGAGAGVAGVLGALAGLAVNEFAVVQAGSQSALVRRRGDRIVRLSNSVSAWDLRPRSKEQRFALDLLLDPEVPVVALSGHAGTGKTILALAAALEQVFEPASARYDRLMILRPIVPVGRQELGYLPGGLEEKLGPWMEAIVDAMVALGDGMSHARAKDMLQAWVDEEKLTMESVTYLRGRSLQRTLVILDEAQNLEALTLKTVLTRLAEGSKCILIGDTAQIDSPWLTERTNAIAVAAEALAGEAIFGHLVLTQGERSLVADRVAALL